MKVFPNNKKNGAVVRQPRGCEGEKTLDVVLRTCSHILDCFFI